MTTYKEAGVDIEAGDNASKIAYNHAAATFESRKGMIGEPVYQEDGYAGFMDMGDYYLVQSDDSTGTKIDLANELGLFQTLGYDLLAMVVDDAVCVGAEVLSVSNCLDVPKIDPTMVDALMSGLSNACSEQRVIIPAGEIAEVPGAVNRGVWSATAVGVVEKDKVITTEEVSENDVVIALQSGVARSNGFSLIRKILQDAHGDDWYSAEWNNGVSWGEIMLTPSVIYHDAVLSLVGRHGEDRKVNVKAMSHITGGGIPSKFRRVLKKTGLGAVLSDLYEPHQAMKDLIELGNVDISEAYKTWNMGNGMLIVVDPSDVDTTLEMLDAKNRNAKVAGVISSNPEIVIHQFTGDTIST